VSSSVNKKGEKSKGKCSGAGQLALPYAGKGSSLHKSLEEKKRKTRSWRGGRNNKALQSGILQKGDPECIRLLGAVAGGGATRGKREDFAKRQPMRQGFARREAVDRAVELSRIPLGGI